MDAKIYFNRFEHNVDPSIVHLPANSVLVVVERYIYEGRASPILEFHLNQTEGTLDIQIPPNSYSYWTKDISFRNVIGIGVFDEKRKMILSPFSDIHGTITEFSVLLSPSTFSLEGMSF